MISDQTIPIAMFNFFKSKPKIEFTDRVWTVGEDKIEGVCRQVAAAIAAGRPVLLVAFFPETLSAYDGELRSRGIAVQRGTPGAIGTPAGRSPVWLVSASQLETGSGSDSGGGGTDLEVILLEHHPLYSRDRVVRESIAGMPVGCRITYHTALDDAIMMRFGGERLRGLMTTLGHEEGTALEHPMISASIERAQEKIEKKVRSETEASSADEWFRFNVD